MSCRRQFSHRSILDIILPAPPAPFPRLCDGALHRAFQGKLDQSNPVTGAECCQPFFQPLAWNEASSGWSSASQLAQGNIPEEVVRAIRLGRLTALQKPDGGVHGIVVGEVFRRVVARTFAQQIERGSDTSFSIRSVHNGLEQSA